MQSQSAAGLHWKLIAILAALFATVAFSLIFGPVISNWLEMRKYATGLSPCYGYPDDIDTLIQRHLPARADLSITVFPAFSSPKAIRLIGNDLYYLSMDFPIYVRGKERLKLNTNGIPQVRVIRLANSTAKQVVEVVANDIVHADAEFPKGSDGVTYYFRTSDQKCGMAWPTDDNTRAWYAARIFDALADRAKARTSTEISAADQAILRNVKKLRAH